MTFFLYFISHNLFTYISAHYFAYKIFARFYNDAITFSDQTDKINNTLAEIDNRKKKQTITENLLLLLDVSLISVIHILNLHFHEQAKTKKQNSDCDWFKINFSNQLKLM